VSHYIVEDLLDKAEAADLLAYAIANESMFVSTSVGKSGKVDLGVRRSRRLAELGTFNGNIEFAVQRLVPRLIENLGVTSFRPTGFEIELVAHGDGAFYKKHIDLFTGSNERGGTGGADRMISLVYYIHNEPKAFEGGDLRLFTAADPALSDERGIIDITPTHGTAVAFSSWLPHEVRPVRCPSARFEDSRFAINCWILRHLNLDDGERMTA
jgi:SM-20-related protein